MTIDGVGATSPRVEGRGAKIPAATVSNLAGVALFGGPVGDDIKVREREPVAP